MTEVLVILGKRINRSSGCKKKGGLTPTDNVVVLIPTTSSQGQVDKIPGTDLAVSKLNGTNLVVDLINSDKGVTIIETSGGNATSRTSDAELRPDGTPGAGSGSTIEFNPSRTTGGVDVTGSTTRPGYIGLAHELGHAKHNAQGKNDRRSSGITEPDGSGSILVQEEVNARHDENKIRTEHKIP